MATRRRASAAGRRLTANEKLLDAAVEHVFTFQRLAKGEATKLVREVEAGVLIELERRLRGRLDRIASRGFDRGPWSTAQLTRLVETIREIVENGRKIAGGRLRKILAEFAAFELEVATGQIEAAVPFSVKLNQPTAAAMRDLWVSRPIHGRTLTEMLKDWSRNEKAALEATVSRGLLRGDDTRMITRFLAQDVERGSRALMRATRTAMTHVQAGARERFYIENDDIVERVLWVSTLDLRTSTICLDLDGTDWPIDDGPRPPAHFNALPAGTLIRTDRGLVPIEEVRVGDSVLTHRNRFCRVSAAMSKRPDTPEIVELHDDAGRVLRATEEHPLLVADLGWVEAGEVEVGQQLLYDDEQVPDAEGAARVDCDSQNCPPLFDERGVFQAVAIAPGCVAPTVDLDGEAFRGSSEIDDPSPEGLLKLEPERYQRGAERGFESRRSVFPPRGGLSLPDLGDDIVAPRGISVAQHSSAVTSEDRVSLGGFAERPMRRAAASLDIGLRRSDRVALAHYGDSEPSGVVAQAAIRHAELPLDQSEGLPEPVMVLGEDGGVVKSRRSRHWIISKVSKVVRRHSNCRVFNLAVERDNSYVADGFVVHNCRSTTVPVLGKSEMVAGKRVFRELDPISRASMDGQVPASVSAKDWLRQQTPERIDTVLGPKLGKLFREGKVDRFTDASFEPLTLAEIERRAGV